MSGEELIRKLKKVVINGDPDEAVKLANEAVKIGLDPLEVINRGLVAGVLELGDMWIGGEAFIADLVAVAKVYVDKILKERKPEPLPNDIGKDLRDTMLRIAKRYGVVELPDI